MADKEGENEEDEENEEEENEEKQEKSSSQLAPNSGYKGIDRHHCFKDKAFTSISLLIILCVSTLQSLFRLKKCLMENDFVSLVNT